MKRIVASVMAIIWGGILGMLLAYIGGQLEASSIAFSNAAIIGAIFAVIITNCVYTITTHANPARKSNN